MSTQDPFITEMRTSLTAFNSKAEQRSIRARKAQRKRMVGRVVLCAVAMVAGLGVGTVIVNITEADAITQAQINRYIKSEGGVPPCTHEDGSGQGICYWNAKAQGNGDGDSYISLPDGKDKDDDKDLVYLTGPLAVRY